MDIAQIIDKRLNELMISQAKFAENIGELPQTVNNWKVRNSVPRDKVRRVAFELGINEEDLLPPKLHRIQEERPAYLEDRETQEMLTIWGHLPAPLRRHVIGILQAIPSSGHSRLIDETGLEPPPGPTKKTG